MHEPTCDVVGNGLSAGCIGKERQAPESLYHSDIEDNGYDPTP